MLWIFICSLRMANEFFSENYFDSFTPKRTKFHLALKKLWQPSEEHLQELLRRHRRTVGVPEARYHCVLNGSLLPVREPDLDLARFLVRWRRRSSDGFVISSAGFGYLRFGLRCDRFAVPFRVTEVMVRVHEVVDREVVFAVVETRSATDDLLELDHRVDGAHQDDVANVAGIHTSRKLL